MCKFKTIEHEVNQVDVQEDTLFIGETKTPLSEIKWSVIIELNDKNINIKIDTGSYVCALSDYIIKTIL